MEVGLIGTGLFIWIFWRIPFCAWYLFTRSDEWFHKAMALAFMSSLAGTFVHSLGTITFYIVRIMEPFWFFTGMIIFLYLQVKEKESTQTQASKNKVRSVQPKEGYSP